VLAYLAVAVGGLIGTGLRLACDLAFPHGDGDFPIETLIVNLVGAFVLGWLVGGLWTRPTTPTWFKAGLGSGVIGSFTTLLYLLVSVIGGLALAAAGLRIGSLIAHRPMPTEVTDAGETL
jgi:CrcB protein